MDVKPIPLTPRGGSDPSADLARTQAMEKAEREFHAMLLREMLRPLTQALFGSENGVSADATPLASGNETYAYFLEQALSQQLAQGWPLPSPFGEPPAPERSDPLTSPATVHGLRSNAMLETRSSPLPISVRNAALPLAPAAQPGAKMPISIDPPARTPRLPVSLDPSVTDTPPFSRSGSAPRVSGDSGVTNAAHHSRSGSAPPVSGEPSVTNAAHHSRSGSAPRVSGDSGVTDTARHTRSESVPRPTADQSALLSAVDDLDPANDSIVPRMQDAPVTSTARSTSPRVGVALPDAEIRRASRLFDLPENLVRAVVLTESGGRANALSPKGAVGYMQVLPSTGKEMGASDLRDTWQNIYAGAKYLRKQLDRFGNLEHALAAYNAGPGAVERHGGIPPYRETRDYVQRVFSWMDRLERYGS